MFDIGWSELLVIAVVAVVVVGPKDLPRMLRTFGAFVAKVKRMAGEFQGQFNEALREAELADVRKSIEEIGDIDPLKELKESTNKIGDEIHQEMNKPFSETKPVVAETEPTDSLSQIAGAGAKVDPEAPVTPEAPKSEAGVAEPAKLEPAKPEPAKPEPAASGSTRA